MCGTGHWLPLIPTYLHAPSRTEKNNSLLYYTSYEQSNIKSNMTQDVKLGSQVLQGLCCDTHVSPLILNFLFDNHG